MGASDLVLLLRSAKKIAELAVEEAGRSTSVYLKTSSLIPRPPPPATHKAHRHADTNYLGFYTNGPTQRHLPISLNPQPSARRKLEALARYRKPDGSVQIKTADLSKLKLSMPSLPPIALRGEEMKLLYKAKPKASEYEAVADEEIIERKLQASRMPANRVSRIYHYGSLAVGVGLGMLGEATKRMVGLGEQGDSDSLLLTKGNIDRIAEKLSKMRGAALKLGQMLSIQDSKDMRPEIAEILQRVQNSANYMPISQLEKTMRKEFGSGDWRKGFSEFSDEPFAAASIGQVHRARLEEGAARDLGFARVAVKVQYPGVANSIESDLSNLQSLLVMSKVLPRGMYLENTIKVARKELDWECDYVREADAMRRFSELLKDDPDFAVPRVVDSLSNKMVLTAEFMDGVEVKQFVDAPQELRDHIGTSVLALCLRELFKFGFMQTDPNWANFLYNRETQKIVLLDFGAARGFGKPFLDQYLMTLKSAMEGDREGCRHWSTELGFLTGYEADIMTQTHVDSLLEIGRPFRESGVYDFGSQDVSHKVRSAIPVMLKHRLTPPPDETYSLHRKLSGAYLLCIMLRARVRCQDLFKSITSGYEFADGSRLKYE